jgi:EAL domain-containing protein (putative c-di-GMP-specific phosphodiesterase class I)
MYKIKGIDFDFKLEPIVDLLDGAVVGYEGLSCCSNSKIENEHFFKSLEVNEHINLLSRQLEKYQKWVDVHPEIYKDKTLCLNVNRELLSADDFYALFLPFNKYYQIGLEIEFDKQECRFNRMESAVIEQLNDIGIKILLDDYLGETIPLHSHDWDAVKIDKEYFWSMFDCQADNSKVVHEIKSRVVCEGVETEEHKDFAVKLGALYGQGYLWSHESSLV